MSIESIGGRWSRCVLRCVSFTGLLLASGWMAAAQDLPTAESQVSVGRRLPPTTQSISGFSTSINAGSNTVVNRGPAELRREIADKIRRFEESQAANDSSPDAQVTLIGHLRFLESVYAQQQLLAEQAGETQQRESVLNEQQTRFDMLGWNALQLNSFLDLEELRNKQDDVRFQNQLVNRTTRSTTSMLESVRDQHASNERQRRQLQEALQRETDSAKQQRLRQEIGVLALRSRIAEELTRLRTQQLEANRIEHAVNLRQIEFYDQAIPAAAKNIPFTQQALGLQLQRWEDEESQLRQLLAQQQQKLMIVNDAIQATQSGDAPSDRRAIDSISRRSGASNSPASDRQPAEQRLQEMRRTLHRNIALANDATTSILLLRQAWKFRYQVVNGLASHDEMRRLSGEADKFLARIHDEEIVLDTRTEETRLDAGIVQRNESHLPDRIKRVQDEIRRDWFRMAAKRRSLLRQAERMYGRLKVELLQQIGSDSPHRRLARLFPALGGWWHYELIAVDDKPITVGKLLSALILMATGILVARFVSGMVGRKMLPRFGIHQGASLALQTIAFYSLFAFFGLLTLELLNIPITVLTFFGGAAAIAVGFGAQNILNNFMSGLIILGEQPIRVGDLIEVDGVHGTVEQIGGRSTRLRTGTNLEMIIPNSKFLENSVTNLTLSSTELRTKVSVGVDYGSDLEVVSNLLRQCVDRHASVLEHPEPIVLFTEFGDNALQFEVHFWIHMRTVMDRERAESEIRKEVAREFRAHGVTVAFPQRDLHVDFRSPVEVHMPGSGPSLLPDRAMPTRKKSA